MATYSDDFTNTDGTALATHNANWTVSAGTIEINTNAARCPTASGTAVARYSGGTFTDDQYSKGIVTFNGGSGYAGFSVRDTGSARYFVLVAASGAWLIRETNAGTLTSGSSTFSDGDEITLQAVGTTISALRNGTQFATVTDSAISSGKAGIYLDNAATNFDRILSWEGGDYSAPTVPTGRGLLLGVG